MDHVPRVIRALVALVVLLAWCAVGFAQSTCPRVNEDHEFPNTGSPPYGGHPTWGGWFLATHDEEAFCKQKNGPTAQFVGIKEPNAQQTAYVTCSYVPSTCPPPPYTCPAAGTGAGRWEYPAGSGSSSMATVYVCEEHQDSTVASPKGCTVKAETDFAYKPGGTTWYGTGQATYTGGTCNPYANGDGSSATPKGEEAPADGDKTGDAQCPSGKVPGEVNGTSVCVTPGPETPTEQKTTEKTTEQKPDGTTTETTETSETTCKDGKCTTTTTRTTTTNGTSSTTTTTSTCTEGQPGCGASGGGGGSGWESSFGGTCSSGFECDGDASVCAVALAAWETRCEFKWTEEIKAVQQQLANGTFAGDLNTNGRTINLAQGFNQENPFGNGCPADVTIATGVVEISIPLSAYCSVLQAMGNVLVAFTLLVATVFVIKGL